MDRTGASLVCSVGSVSRQGSVLSRLELWYSHQCNGTWEHSLGVRIESCDNPGWWVKVNLEGTRLEHVAFPEIAEHVDAARGTQGSRWLHCGIEGRIWHRAGDETKLARILELFLDWAETYGAYPDAAVLRLLKQPARPAYHASG